MIVVDVLNQKQLHDLFYSEEMKVIRAKHYKAAYDQGRFDEYAERLNEEKFRPRFKMDANGNLTKMED
jgi:ATP-dependent Lon protease